MKISQRDSFWNKIYEIALKDKDVIIVSADMGAPSLDKFRADLPDQFVNVGIAEQNGALVAAGLALEGKRVYFYAIAPFVTLRCLEQIRVENAMMKIPMTIVGVGAGFSYDYSGPTHHLIEDISIMRSMPNIEINSISDSAMAEKVAEMSYNNKSVRYVRLERALLPDIYDTKKDFNDGCTVVTEGSDGYIISTGAMVHSALSVSKKLSTKNLNYGVIDLYSIPSGGNQLLSKIKNASKIITLEEHFLEGGLGSFVLELLNDKKINIPLQRLGLSMNKGYCYKYGGREVIRSYYDIDLKTLENRIIEGV